jgi:hypothetical protein
MSTEARRMRAFSALAAICVIGAAIVVIAGSTSAGNREKASQKAVAAARPSVEKVLAGHEPFVVFRDLDRADTQNFSRLSIAPVVDGKPGPRLLAGPACDRVAFRSGEGLCLATPNVGAFKALVLDARMRVVHRVSIAGLASRARISPDGHWGGVTAFVSGHSYADTGAFSTMATIIDMRTGKKLGDIEHDFTVRRDGQVVDARDRNYWGLTFAADGDTFYATLGTGGHTYLIRGSIRSRSAETIHENVECPSLSPDETRIAYKKAVGRAKGAHNPVLWRFTVLDLATGKETPLAETRSLDDQIEWLDDRNVLYRNLDSTWTMPADGSGRPAAWLRSADSVVVGRRAGT